MPNTKIIRQIQQRLLGNVSATPGASSKGDFVTGLGIRVNKAAATIPQTTSQTIFTVTGGRVLVTLLFGEVTTVIQAGANNMSVESDPTVGVVSVLSSGLDIASLAVGILLTSEMDGTALIQGNAGMLGTGQGKAIISAGIITCKTDASKTGATKWTLYYYPIDDGAYVS